MSGGHGNIEVFGVFQLRCRRRVEMVTLRSLECFNWVRKDRVGMVTLRSMGCFK